MNLDCFKDQIVSLDKESTSFFTVMTGNRAAIRGVLVQGFAI